MTKPAAIRSNCYAYSPGSACPGLLEWTPRGLEFTPNEAMWAWGGIGGRRAVTVPAECIRAVERSSRLAVLRWFWPGGRLLMVTVQSGRKLFFGVPGVEDWVRGIPVRGDAAEPCPELDSRLKRLRRDPVIDVLLVVAGVLVCAAVMIWAGEIAGLGAIGALFAGRFAFRSWLFRPRARRGVPGGTR